MDFTLKRNNWAEDSLRVLAEELAYWVPVALGDIDQYNDNISRDEVKSDDPVDSFVDSLLDGVRLCHLAEACAPHSNWPDGAEQPVADVRCRCNASAKPGSFQARDNVQNFIAACKELGVPEINLFSTEDLMQKQNLKQVFNCIMALSKIGVENGISPPQIVQYELEIDQYIDEAEEEEEEKEELVPAQYGLTAEQLEVIENAFERVTEDKARVTNKKEFVMVLMEDEEIDRLIGDSELFASFFTNAETNDTSEIDLGDFLSWFCKKKDPAAASSSSLDPSKDFYRPRALSARNQKPEFNYLPYIPKQGDEVDEALAKKINENYLDIRVRRIAILKRKKHFSAYRIGKGSQPKSFIRQIRGLLMVRNGNTWEDVVVYIQRKMAEASIM